MLRYLAKRFAYYLVLLIVSVFLAYALSSAALNPGRTSRTRRPARPPPRWTGS